MQRAASNLISLDDRSDLLVDRSGRLVACRQYETRDRRRIGSTWSKALRTSLL
jgi:hypothetical protein